MEGARVGIWCAHGEGRAHFPDAAVQNTVLEQNLAPIRCKYVLRVGSAGIRACGALHGCSSGPIVQQKCIDQQLRRFHLDFSI